MNGERDVPAGERPVVQAAAGKRIQGVGVPRHPLDLALTLGSQREIPDGGWNGHAGLNRAGCYHMVWGDAAEGVGPKALPTDLLPPASSRVTTPQASPCSARLTTFAVARSSRGSRSRPSASGRS